MTLFVALFVTVAYRSGVLGMTHGWSMLGVFHIVPTFAK